MGKTLGPGVCIRTWMPYGASDPENKIYIGNIRAAESRTLLKEHGVDRIVNCQDTSSRNFHEKDQILSIFGFQSRIGGLSSLRLMRRCLVIFANFLNGLRSSS